MTNLLFIVARHNVERIYGDGRLDFIDDDFIEAVIDVGKGLPGAPRPEEKAKALARRLRAGSNR